MSPCDPVLVLQLEEGEVGVPIGDPGLEEDGRADGERGRQGLGVFQPSLGCPLPYRHVCASWGISELQHLDELGLIAACAYCGKTRQNNQRDGLHTHCFSVAFCNSQA